MEAFKLKVGKESLVLANMDKVRRIVEGDTDAQGRVVPGLGEGADPMEVAVAYDKIAGLITGKDGAKVKMGCFWNVKEKKAQENPVVIYTFKVDGKSVDIEAEKDLPLEVKATVKAKKEEKKDSKKK